MLQRLIFTLVLRPLIAIVVGLNVRHRERLPTAGPAIVLANHNSHVDTVALMSLFAPAVLSRVRPVAAGDHFLRRPGLLAFIATRVMRIIAIDRQARERGEDPLVPVLAALDRGEIVILYPEGTRGEPERLGRFKRGIFHLAEARPEVPIVPVFLVGFGKVLPKGSWIPVPFFCDVFVGEALPPEGRPQGKEAFIAWLEAAVAALPGDQLRQTWD